MATGSFNTDNLANVPFRPGPEADGEFEVEDILDDRIVRGTA